MFCGQPKTIEHLLYTCTFAKAVWRDVKRAWSKIVLKVMISLGDPAGVIVGPGNNFWNMVCLGRKSANFILQWNVVQAITAYHIWQTSCTSLYKELAPPSTGEGSSIHLETCLPHIESQKERTLRY